jgi:DNA-binding PadR family transcriptional regulator
MPRTTELEGCVLGVVWEKGPCTPYTIRKVFQDSPSPHWTGSAGAIYPLVARLATRRLIRADARRSSGRRGATTYRITPSGLEALKRWLGPPLPEWAIGVPVDALRTRLRFLGAVPAPVRRAFLAEAETRLRDHLRVVEKECRRSRAGGDPFAYLVSRGALSMLQARSEWLREVRRTLAKPMKSGRRWASPTRKN